MTLAGRPPIWLCYPNLLTCQAGHAQVFYHTGLHVDQRRLDGHIVVLCELCKPVSHAFAVVHSRPSPIVHLYAISKAQYDWFRDTPDKVMQPPLEEGHETEDLLHRFGYNPSYQRRA